MSLDYKDEEYIAFLKTRISSNVKPEVADKMIEYALTPQEHARTLEKIKEFCFSGKSPVSAPKAFLVISQTGGGKSTLTSSIIKSMNGNVVVIDSDAFKAFNPRRDEISANHKDLYGFLTGIDAYLHRDEIYSMALENKYNILIEVAPSTKERLFNVNIDELLQYGYSIQACVLGVSKINSLLSIHERYEGQIEAGMEAPKLTDLKRAIDSYNSVSMIVDDLTKLPNVEVKLFKRANFDEMTDTVPVPIFVSDDKQNMPAEYKKVVEEDFEKCLPTVSKRMDTVKAQMSRRGASEAQFNQFSAVCDIVNQESKTKR